MSRTSTMKVCLLTETSSFCEVKPQNIALFWSKNLHKAMYIFSTLATPHPPCMAMSDHVVVLRKGAAPLPPNPL